MDAIVTAGGVLKYNEPLWQTTRQSYKALIDVAGKPMIQWVLDALGTSSGISRVVVVGLPDGMGLYCSKPVTFLHGKGGMMENSLIAVKHILEEDPFAEYCLVVSSDIPAITARMIDWVIQSAVEPGYDIYYNIISRSVMEQRFPGVKRSYLRVKEVEACGADMHVFRTLSAVRNDAVWTRMIEKRKYPFIQVILLGLDILFLSLFKKPPLEKATKLVSRRLGIHAKVTLCPYAEIGMDVDKPDHLQILRDELANRNR